MGGGGEFVGWSSSKFQSRDRTLMPFVLLGLI